jgi:hypothetical protein
MEDASTGGGDNGDDAVVAMAIRALQARESSTTRFE